MKYLAKWVPIAALIASCSTSKQFRNKDPEQIRKVTANRGASVPDIRINLSISKRRLYVLKGDDTLRKYAVAVGQAKYPTPVGNFKIYRVDWNPEWNPPESDWTKDKSYAPPGDAANPMGRVRIVYQMPYTIHGTKEVTSLGKAVSHGSVRMANRDVIELAKFLMRESGSQKSSDWYQQVLGTPNKMVSVTLRKQIPLVNSR